MTFNVFSGTLNPTQSCRVRRKKLSGWISGAVCTGQGNDFELIPTVKMETIGIL